MIDNISIIKKEQYEAKQNRHIIQVVELQVVRRKERDLQFHTKPKPCMGLTLLYHGFNHLCTITSQLDGTMTMEVALWEHLDGLI